MSKRKKKKKHLGKPKKSYSTFYQQGLQLFRNQDYKKAIKAWREALRLTQDKDLSRKLAQAHFRYALSLHRPQQGELIISELHQSIKRDSEKAIYHYHLGLIYHEQHQYANAVSSYKQAVKLDPKNERFLHHLQLAQWENHQSVDTGKNDIDFNFLSLIRAENYKKAKEYAEAHGQELLHEGILYKAIITTMVDNGGKTAKKLWKKCQEISEYSMLACYYLGLIYTQEKKWTSALKHLEMAVTEPKLKRDCESALLMIYKYQASELVNSGEEKKAKRFWNKIAEIDPSDELAYNSIATVIEDGYRHAVDGNISQAMRTWKRVINKGSNHPLLLQNYAIACDKQENFSQALENWEELAIVWQKQIANKDASESLKAKLSLVYRRIGELFFEEEDLARAEKAYSNALRYNPGDLKLELRLVYLDFERENINKALSKLKHLHKQHPQNVKITEMMVTAYLDKEDLGKAIECTITLLELQPKHQEARELIHHLGRTYTFRLLEDDELDSACQILKNLIKVDGNFIVFRTLLAQVLFRKKQKSEAEKELELVIELATNKALAHAEVGKTYVLLNRGKEAQVHLKKAEELSSDPDCLCALAVAHLLYNKKIGMRYLKKYVATDPNNYKLYINISEEMLAYNENLALDVMTQGMKAHPESIELSMSLLILAMKLEEFEVFDKVANKLRKLAIKTGEYDIIEVVNMLEMMLNTSDFLDDFDDDDDDFDDDNFDDSFFRELFS